MFQLLFLYKKITKYIQIHVSALLVNMKRFLLIRDEKCSTDETNEKLNLYTKKVINSTMIADR